MKVSTVIGVCLSALLHNSHATASGFEFCDLAGNIRGVAMSSSTEYALSVQVTKAARARHLGEQSYTDCHEHVGEVLQVAFTAAELPRVPALGDRIAFSRSVVDGFGDDGAYAGTSISTRLHALRRARGTSGR